jgi:CPA1 family monovalent cation:H+ antiporter
VARVKANEAALARLDELARDEKPDEEILHRLRVEYEDRLRQLEACAPNGDRERLHLFSSDYERLASDALRVERNTVVQLRNEGVINDEVLRRIQRDIDLAEARL